MDASAAAAAAARKRVKRAMGLLRAAAGVLAAEAGDLDVVAEVHVTGDAGAQEVLELIRLARARGYRDLDVIIVARPRGDNRD